MWFFNPKHVTSDSGINQNTCYHLFAPLVTGYFLPMGHVFLGSPCILQMYPKSLPFLTYLQWHEYYFLSKDLLFLKLLLYLWTLQMLQLQVCYKNILNERNFMSKIKKYLLPATSGPENILAAEVMAISLFIFNLSFNTAFIWQ